MNDMRTTALTVMMLLSACAGPGLLNPGPDRYQRINRAVAPAEGNRTAKSLPPVQVEVTPEDVLAHRFHEAVVISHLKPGPADVATETWTLQLQLRQGRLVNVRYTAPGGLLLPVGTGDRVVARVYESTGTNGGGGVALILRATDGRLLAALVSNLDLAADGLDSGLGVRRSERRTHQSLHRTESLCMVLSEHFAIRFHSEDEVLYLRPGERHVLSYRGTIFDVIALQAARMTHQTCANPRTSTLSYALIAQAANR
jgi:hypothetical protein